MNTFFRIEFRLLFEVADRQVRHRDRIAVDVGVDTGHDAQDRRLARPVEPQNADLRAGEKAQGDIFENLLLRGHDLADPMHGIDILGHLPTLSRATSALLAREASL